MYVNAPGGKPGQTVRTGYGAGARSALSFNPASFPAPTNLGASYSYTAGRTRSNTIKSNGVIPTPYSSVAWNISGTGSAIYRQNQSTSGTPKWLYSLIENLGCGAQVSTLHQYGSTGYIPDAEVRMLSMSSNVHNEALADLVSGYGLQLANSVLELKQTWAMTAGNLIKGALAWRKLRRGNVRGAIDILTGGKSPRKFFANSYLEFQYGWRPLASDIHAGLEILDKGIDEIKASVRSVREEPWTPAKGSTTINISSGIKIFAECKIVVKAGSEQLYKLSSLGILNPASIAWEAVPFSFVVDWFLPIGDYLSAFSAPLLCDLDHGYVTSGYRGTAIEEYHYYQVGTGLYPWYNQSGTLKSRYEVMRMSRSVVGNLLPSPPMIDLQLNSQRLLNALALLNQRR